MRPLPFVLNLNLRKMNFRSFRSLVWVSVALLPLLASSCKDPGEEERNHEKKVLQAYIAEKNITVEPTKSGLYYIEEVKGTGLSPERSEYVQIHYTMKILDQEILLTTTDSAIAKAEDSYSEHKLYGPERILLGTVISGLEEGLKLMKEGGEAKLVIPSSLAWGASYYGSVPPYSPVLMSVKLEKVIKDLPGYERDLLSQYLSEQGLSLSDSTASGIYIIHVEEGTGLSPKKFDGVKAYVKGSLSDERMFLKDLNLRWSLGQETSTVFTKGLNDGIDSMRVGGKAKIIVPYKQGYGAGSVNSYMDNRKGPIPPYSTLYYDVELIDIIL